MKILDNARAAAENFEKLHRNRYSTADKVAN